MKPAVTFEPPAPKKDGKLVLQATLKSTLSSVQCVYPLQEPPQPPEPALKPEVSSDMLHINNFNFTATLQRRYDGKSFVMLDPSPGKASREVLRVTSRGESLRHNSSQGTEPQPEPRKRKNVLAKSKNQTAEVRREEEPTLLDSRISENPLPPRHTRVFSGKQEHGELVLAGKERLFSAQSYNSTAMVSNEPSIYKRPQYQSTKANSRVGSAIKEAVLGMNDTGISFFSKPRTTETWSRAEKLRSA